jgi:hypothetical protein
MATPSDKQAMVRGAIIGSVVGFVLGGTLSMVALGCGLSATLHGLFGNSIDRVTGRIF